MALTLTIPGDRFQAMPIEALKAIAASGVKGKVEPARAELTRRTTARLAQELAGKHQQAGE